MPDASAGPPAGSGAERRQFPRLPAKIPVHYRMLADSRPKPSITEDISGGGLRLHLDEWLEPHTPLRIEIAWPDKAPTTFVCEVAWCVPCPSPMEHGQAVEAGVTFVEIHPADRQVVLGFIERHRDKSA